MPKSKDKTKFKELSKTRRNATSHKAILEATVKLIETNGYKQLTIEGIASEAGVGKQTIYRWWRSKADLVMEAYMSASDVRVPEPDTGTLAGDLLAILLPVFELNQDYQQGTALANKSLMAEAQLDTDFLATYGQLHRHWWGPLTHVLERAKTRGELVKDADVGVLIDMMLGAAWYRMLLEHAPLDEAFARTLVNLIAQGAASKNVP